MTVRFVRPSGLGPEPYEEGAEFNRVHFSY